jgi:hypothetical protein
MRLSTPGVRIARAVFSRKQVNQNHPDNESPDMGPPRDSAGICSGGSKRSCSVEELHDEPEPQHDESGNLNDLNEYKNRYECQNTSAGVRDKISAQHSGNGAAGADAGDGHVVVQYCMDNPCAQSAEKIKYEVPEVAQTIFDVVAIRRAETSKRKRESRRQRSADGFAARRIQPPAQRHNERGTARDICLKKARREIRRR